MQKTFGFAAALAVVMVAAVAMPAVAKSHMSKEASHFMAMEQACVTTVMKSYEGKHDMAAICQAFMDCMSK